MTRYTAAQAASILQRAQEDPLDRLDRHFAQGTVPPFAQIQGDTAGAFLVPSTQNPWYVNLARWGLFESPWARWQGKRFIDSWEHGAPGTGVNLFAGGRERYRFTTSIEPAHGGVEEACLVLDYRPSRGRMYGLVDDVRLVQPGVCLGRMHWEPREWAFIGYFMLVALAASPSTPEA